MKLYVALCDKGIFENQLKALVEKPHFFVYSVKFFASGTGTGTDAHTSLLTRSSQGECAWTCNTGFFPTSNSSRPTCVTCSQLEVP